MNKRIGLFGGTFDPVHKGHINAAATLFKKLKLDRLYLIPAFISPLKKKIKPINHGHRLKMIQIAIEEHDFLNVSDLRISVPIVLYSFTQEKNIKKDKKMIKLSVFINQEFIVKIHILLFIIRFQKAFQNRNFHLF